MLAKIAVTITEILTSRRSKASGPPHILIYQVSDSLLAQRAAYDQLLSRLQSINQALEKSENDFKSVSRAIQSLPEAKEAAIEYVNKARSALDGNTRSPVAALAGLQGLNEGITAVNSTLQSVIQLVSLFRTDTTITGLAINLDADAVSAQLGHLLQVSNLAPVIEYPSLLVNTDSPVLIAIGNMKQKQGIVSPRAGDIDALLARLGTQAANHRRTN